MFLYFWWTALGLALWSLLAMMFMILRRLWLQHRQRADRRRQAELRQLLFAWGEDEERPELPSRDRRLLMELGHHLLNTVRGDEARRIARLLQQSGAVAEGITQLKLGRAPERIRSAEGLGHFVADDARVREALNSSLARDREVRVRLASARSLLRGGHPPETARLIDRLWCPGKVSMRGFQELLRHMAPGAHADLAAFIDEHPAAIADHRLTALLVDALGHALELGHLPLLRRLAVEGEHPDIRAAAFRALAALGHPGARDAIAQGLRDPSWAVRSQAIIAASRIGLSEFIPSVAEALHAPEWWVRLRAAQALHAFGPNGISQLRAAARGEDGSGASGEAALVAQLVLEERGA